ncbi:MAG: response regulator [Candidatus Omnitrophica bacterium]|nr:response regulator [Candidatus Omnitrophota bacterium]MBU1925566.1 response regulator [Candidatus Omnitrophota bacterium]
MLKILVVDDEPEITEILKNFFLRKNYHVSVAYNGQAALDIIKEERPHLVFLDIRMPVMDGLTVLRNIRQMDTSIKVIMVTALEDENTVNEAKKLGAVDYVRKPFQLDYMEKEVLEKVNTQLFGDLRQEIEEKNKLIEQLAQEVKRANELNKKLKRNFYQTILSLATALEARDRYTHGHSERVDIYSTIIAQELKDAYGFELDDKFFENLHIEARLHDIGKIAIVDTVLNKPGRLTQEEYEIIKIHPLQSAHILAPLEDLTENIEVIKHHHERYDGKGYPDSLSGDMIHLRARIIAAADSFDAMTSDRPYRKAMEIEVAVTELEKNKGTQFDVKVIEAFVSAYKKGEFKLAEFK